MIAPLADVCWPPFAPHPLLRNTHLMTAATQLPRRGVDHVVERAERREIEVDSETCVVAFLERQPADEDAPTALLVHGLSGNAGAAYMLGTADKLHAEGFHVVRLNVRNCGDTEHMCRGMFHSGLTDDVSFLLDLLVRQGDRRIYMVGFSMGANIVVKLAGELGSDAPQELRGVVGVSPPIDLPPCAVVLDNDLRNRLYKDHFLAELCRKYRRKAELFPELYDPAAIEGVSTFAEFDDRVTAPAMGWSGHAEYYQRASARPWVPRIEVPTLLVHARDDTIVPASIFEVPEIGENSNLYLIGSARGGHCGFIGRRAASSQGWSDRDRYWAENRIVQFLCVLEHRAGARLVESRAQ